MDTESTLDNRMPLMSAISSRMKKYFYQLIADEVSTVTKYYDRVVQLLPRSNDSGDLFERLQCPEKVLAQSLSQLPNLQDEVNTRTAILVNGNFNHSCDIQDLLNDIHKKMARTTRFIAVLYNPYLAFLFRLANWLGLRTGELPTTFLTTADVKNLAHICSFEMVRIRPAVYCPWRLWGVGAALNSILAAIPLVRMLSLTSVVVLRPILRSTDARPSLSIVIPARNEFGNIENALKRMPDFGAKIEVIFVEGHSKDDTWAEILRVQELYKDKFDITAVQQTGKGKSDAVRLGFSKAKCDLLTILDADLTMPPEKLTRFYDAYCNNLADFVNGSRLVYPMENEAMRTLNKFGNKFFAKTLSWILGAPITDSLCGTKLLTRQDYTRMIAWRNDFGDFDPFGDFELIFPAATLGLGIVDIPIAYRNRVYGTTQIRRFYHGMMLFRMVWVGFVQITLGRS